VWYFIKDSQPIGPVDIDALNESFRLGSLGPNAFVWHPGMEDWARASTVPAIWSEPTALPLLHSSDDDEPSSHPNYLGLVLRVCGSVFMVVLLYSLSNLANEYLSKTDLRPEGFQANVLTHHPERPSHRLE